MRFTTGHKRECGPRSCSKNGASVTSPFLCGTWEEPCGGPFEPTPGQLSTLNSFKKLETTVQGYGTAEASE